MVELPTFVRAGMVGTIAIQDGPKVEVRAAWWADQRCGLAFAEPIDLGWLASAAAKAA